MTSAELHALLEPHGIRPIKGRSQHFLLDESVVEAMVDAAGIKKGSRVLEIGPGPGILTDALLRRGAEVVAVEIDLKLRNLLASRFGESYDGSGSFTLKEGDALRHSNEEIASSFPSGAGEYSLIANLPYSITSAVLQKYLLETPMPAQIVVMIQKEVADRLLAKRGEMRSLSVLAQTYAQVTRIREVPPGAFIPPPRVDSTVVRLVRKNDAELREFFGTCTPERYFAIVQAGFSSPRKQLKNTLRGVVSDAEALEFALHKAKIDPSARPETLSVRDWSRLCQALS